jgi:SpoVK/Ycf46/Vps4 family AAA+-type ATPase
MMGVSKSDEAPDAPTSNSGLQNWDPVGWNIEDIGIDQDENPTDPLAMNDKMQDVVRQVEFWHTHETWYRDREIPWKFGALLHGPPGTGKTSLVRAIALKFDLPVYSFDLSTMNSREFVNYWETTRTDKTRIILLEDIDAVFHGRKNAIEGHRLSYDVLLNVIDGIEPDDGQLLFVTTNKIELVDEALGRPDAGGNSTRPGRIDMTFEIGALDHAGRLKLANRILKDDLMAEKVALEFPDDTPVVFRERCRKLAIEMLWKAPLTSRDPRGTF